MANNGPSITSSTNQAPGLSATWSDNNGTALIKPDGTLVSLLKYDISPLLTAGNTSQNAATANIKAINASLASGGTVSITTPGIYYVNASLVMFSNSNFNVGPGVIIRQLSGTNGAFLVTNAWLNGIDVVCTSVTASDTAHPNLCTVTTATPHGYAAGQWIAMNWMTQHGFNGVVQVATLTDSTHFTYYSDDIPSATPATVFDEAVNGTITAITKASGAVVTISNGGTVNPFIALERVRFTGVSGMTQINGLYGKVTAVGGSTGAWTVTTDINSSAFSVWTSGGTLQLLTIPIAQDALLRGVGVATTRAVDTNINIFCYGSFDKNNNGATGALVAMGVQIAFVKGCQLYLDNLNNQPDYALYTSMVRDVRVYKVSCLGKNSIALYQHTGWGRGIIVDECNGATVDNTLTFATYDGPSFVGDLGISCGDLQFYVNDVQVESTVSNVPCVFLFGPDNFSIDGYYQKIKGSMDGPGSLFQTLSDGGGLGNGTGPWLRNIYIGDIQCSPGKNGGGYGIPITMNSTKCEKFDVGLTLQGPGVLDGIQFNASTGFSTRYNNVTVRINSMTTDFLTGGGSIIENSAATSTIDNLNIQAGFLNQVPNSGFLLQNKGIIKNVSINASSITGFQSILNETVAATGKTHISVNGTALNNNGAAAFVSAKNTDYTALMFTGCTINWAKGFKRTGSGLFKVCSGGNNWQPFVDALPASSMLDTSSTQLSIEMYGSDIYCDPAQLTAAGSSSGAGHLIISNTTVGQTCRSANSGANMAGAATCVTSHWFVLASGAAAINTQITGT